MESSLLLMKNTNVGITKKNHCFMKQSFHSFFMKTTVLPAVLNKNNGVSARVCTALTDSGVSSKVCSALTDTGVSTTEVEKNRSGPNIGLLTYPGPGIISLPDHPDGLVESTNTSYLTKNLVEIIHRYGGNVIPLVYGESDENFLRKIKFLDGIIVGGNTALWDSAYHSKVLLVFEEFFRINSGGEFLPLLCIGSACSMIKYYLGDGAVDIYHRQSCNWVTEQGLTGMIFPDKQDAGTIFEIFPEKLKHDLKADKVYYCHHNILSLRYVYSTKFFNMNYKVVSVSFGRGVVPYVSSFSGKQLPFSGVQWHPEVRFSNQEASELLFCSFLNQCAVGLDKKLPMVIDSSLTRLDGLVVGDDGVRVMVIEEKYDYKFIVNV